MQTQRQSMGDNIIMGDNWVCDIYQGMIVCVMTHSGLFRDSFDIHISIFNDRGALFSLYWAECLNIMIKYYTPATFSLILLIRQICQN